jgi:hypothetical protein
MQRIFYAVIVNNFIENVFPWDGHSSLGPAISIPANSTVMPLSEAEERGYNYPEIPEIVPNEIESYQLRDWLIVSGKKQTVESIIANIPDLIERERVLNRWEYATKIPRNHIIVKMIAKVLGMTDADIDKAFIEASKQ